MEDKEKIENKKDVKKEIEKNFKRKIIISQIIIIPILIVEIAVLSNYIYDKINNTTKSHRWRT